MRKVDQFASAERGQICIRADERLPFESLIGNQYLAFVAAGARWLLHGSRRPLPWRSSGLVAMDDIERRERSREIAR
jgi:hypothetical protein